jgi:hypothetical protein
MEDEIYKIAEDRLAVIHKRNEELEVLKKNYYELLEFSNIIIADKDKTIKSLEETDRTNYLFFIFCIITGSLFLLLDFFK